MEKLLLDLLKQLMWAAIHDHSSGDGLAWCLQHLTAQGKCGLYEHWCGDQTDKSSDRHFGHLYTIKLISLPGEAMTSGPPLMSLALSHLGMMLVPGKVSQQSNSRQQLYCPSHPMVIRFNVLMLFRQTNFCPHRFSCIAWHPTVRLCIRENIQTLCPVMEMKASAT